MRYRLATLALVAIATGCAGVLSAPQAVHGTLAAVESLGFRCGDGEADHVPSGLYQWRCKGDFDGVSSTVLVEGNADGVAGITLVTDDSTDPNVARAAFARLVGNVPPLRTAPVLADTLGSWSGEQTSEVVGGVRIFAECADTMCIVMVTDAIDPLRPLPLP